MPPRKKLGREIVIKSPGIYHATNNYALMQRRNTEKAFYSFNFGIAKEKNFPMERDAILLHKKEKKDLSGTIIT
jgi:hypothetical protein